MGTRTRSGDRVATEEIGSAKGLYLWVISRTTSRVDPPSRKTAALAAALAFAAGEARAAEQPSHAAQQGTVESTTIINGKVAEPVPGATTPVAPPPVERPPAEAPTPPPPPKHETPPAGEEPSPPPLEPAPSTPEPDAPPPTPQPAPQWFEVVVTYGEVVESDPVLTTSRSVTDFGQMLEPETIADTSTYAGDPAPARAVAPAAVDDDGYASGPASDSALSIPGPAPAAVPPPREDNTPLPTPTNGAPAKGIKPSGTAGPVPASVGRALRLPSSLGTTAVSAVETVQSAAASVASATAGVFGSLAGDSPGTSSSNNPTDGPQEQHSEGTPHQAPPVAPPGGGGYFAPSTGGGGQLVGSGGSFAPLLFGILALLAVSLMRRDFRTYLISCEMPKPSSALLLPLERPG